MVIIITAAIAPKSSVKQLVLRDPKERLNQYISALEHMIDKRPDAKLVFCDNSGFGIEAFEDVKRKALDNNMELEVLSFTGDSEKAAQHGKGYGEGEIVKYALENSKLIAGEDYMIKVTGRLKVDNIAAIVRRVRRNRVYFNVPNIHRTDIFDTRIYAMPIDVFKDYFMDYYQKVDDEGGYYLEHAYTDAILENHIKTSNFPRYPRIIGSSGSGGARYEYTEWKCKIRDVLSLWNVYGRVRNRKNEDNRL